MKTILKTHNTTRLKRKLHEIYEIEPNSLALDLPTKAFKYLTRILKIMPFLYILPFAFVVSVVCYLVFGERIVSLASLLQYGS